MSSSAVMQLVSFLTRPLMRTRTPATIASLQLSLRTAFATLPAESSLFLSGTCPPPPAVQRACIVSGILWADWIRALSGGIDVQVYITPATLAVKLGRMPRRVLWKCAQTQTVPTSLSAFRFPAAAASVRPRRGAAALHPTRIPSLLSSCSYDALDLELDSDSDSECDSDSASECDSDSSFTSASSASSHASSFASMRAIANAKREYKYNGGVTQVVSGGVMLGLAPSTPAPAPESKPRHAFASARPSGISWITRQPTSPSSTRTWTRSTSA
ncbi:hypothetical protein C8R47DRAFT_1107183 [Mycena vitilis]|nr:hypothetical protein C8R47DRAFT_1107183 [Mycena vitilis]